MLAASTLALWILDRFEVHPPLAITLIVLGIGVFSLLSDVLVYLYANRDLRRMQAARGRACAPADPSEGKR